jgi:hypothetical protein
METIVRDEMALTGQEACVTRLCRSTVLAAVYNDYPPDRVVFVDCSAFRSLKGPDNNRCGGDSEGCMVRMCVQRFVLCRILGCVIRGLHALRGSGRSTAPIALVFWCPFGYRRSVAVATGWTWLAHQMRWRVSRRVAHLSANTWNPRHCQGECGMCGMEPAALPYACLVRFIDAWDEAVMISHNWLHPPAPNL